MSTPKDDLIATGRRTISPNYAPAPIVFERGQGVWLTDSEGNRYLDFVAGIAVCSLGHGHPQLSAALSAQAEKLLHVSNMYFTKPQIELMEHLTDRSFADRVFLCNSGTEANEAAFKLARRYQSRVADRSNKSTILSMKSSFHGRTLASITATGQPKYHDGFAPLAPGFEYLQFNDIDAVERRMDDDVAAIVVEPIQGEGGIRPASEEFLHTLRQLCDQFDALLIYDEVQTGVGRTGSLFAYEHFGVKPDIMTLAKGLGGGVPLGATLATEEVWKGWKRGSHASTFGGNPLASCAGQIVLNVIEEQDLLTNAKQRGEQLRRGLQELTEEFDALKEVRGVGLMLGVECGAQAKTIAKSARQQGLLINTAGGDTLRFVPPLIIDESDVAEALQRLRAALDELNL